MRAYVMIAAALTSLAPLAPAQSTDPRISQIVSAPSARRLEADDRKLVSFGTRHTMSDTLSETRGIGAARRWIKSVFDSISSACKGCLEVRYVADMVGPSQRIPNATNVVSVVAIQRGTMDTGRVLIMTGHFDSRNSNGNDAAGDAPGVQA